MAKLYAGKQARQARKPVWSVFVGVGALALVIVGVIVLTRQPAMQAPRGATTTQSGPRVAVDREKLDFGAVKMDTPVTAAFKVRNAGSEPLQILGLPQVRVVEGC